VRMKKIHLLLLVILPVFASTVLFLPHTASAQEKNLEGVIDELLSQIQKLQLMVEQRETIGSAEPVQVEESIAQYFFLREQANVDNTIYGDKSVEIILEGDGGVTQILVEQDCDRNTIIIGQGPDSLVCEDQLWLTVDDKDGGVHSFSLFATYVGGSEIDSDSFTVFACRFNGCQEDLSLELEYKAEKVLVDYVKITNRYEYEYEYVPSRSNIVVA